MAAGKVTPTVLGANDLKLDPAELSPRITVTGLSVPQGDSSCIFVEGENDADSGRQLASKLRSDKLI